MPQGPLSADVATNPQGTKVSLKTNTNGDLLITTDPSSYSSTTLAVASLVKNVPGALISVNNLNMTNLAYLNTTQAAALTSTSIGAFYNVGTTQLLALTTTQTAALTPTAVIALTTTQVAALASTQIVALVGQTIQNVKFDTPYTNGLVFVPGTGQIVDVIYE